MITVELMGGLGNQLFQIFAVLGHALRYNVPFVFLDKTLEHGWRKTTYWNSFLDRLQPYLRSPHTVQIFDIMRETQFHYAEIPSHIGIGNTCLFGYFQSWKYFDHCKPQLFELLSLEKKRQSVCGKMVSQWENLDHCISMHFRMGDYKNLQNHHPIMSVAYYRKALTELLLHTGKDDWTVMVVCEDEDAVSVHEKTNVLREEFPNMRFRRLQGNLEDWEQMLAMSLCAHHIIANSSFSWFGAYFNTNPDKFVYYPSVWFGPAQGNKDLRDLCPPDWMKISV